MLKKKDKRRGSPPEGPGTPPSNSPRGNVVEVEVRDFRERPLPGARVVLRPAAGVYQVRIGFDERTSTFRAADVKPGPYVLAVSHRGYEAQTREIEVQPAGNREIVILGTQGMPAFYRGKVRVPFEPHPDLIAATLRGRRDPRAQSAVEQTARRLGLEPQEVPEPVRQSNVLVFRLPGQTNEGRKREIVGELLRQPEVQLAGPVVLLRDRSLSYMTNELIVRFRAHVTEESVRKIAREHGLEILRPVPYSPNTYHLSSPGPASYELLAVADALARREDVEWAEPSLVTTVELDAINPTDFLWNGVWDRQLVDTPNAWQHLQDAGLQPFGSPDVIIAAVDQGLESMGGVPAHADFQGTVSDGSTKVYRLFDFDALVPNNDAPLGDHGMGVSGVAAARAENPSVIAGQTEGLAGAAPNCRIMGLIFPSAEVDIADMYIWAAGFDPHSPRAGFPAPISPGADIFTTSIGFGAGAPISGLASAMLDFLMTYGRGGKGCLCFFSGGNANNNFTTYRPWAAYEKTFGMAASTLANDGVTEIRAPYSGFGPVELCAPSHDEYVMGLAVHNPPDHYGTWSCQLVGDGNLIGHAATQTTLTAAATTGQTVLNVASVAGFAAGNQLLVGLPGTPGSEPVEVTGAPNAMTNTIPVTALLNNHAIGAAVLTGPANYRNDFGGTSSATPLTAGVAALVLSANPDLTWIEARQILRDTAEKIDAANTHPTGQWLDANGNPSVTSGLPPVYSQWYGFGRVDAERAVDEALDDVFSRDLVVRDNLADVGVVPAGGAFWNSPDLWVRTTDPVVEGAAGLPPNYATAGPHQSPIAGQDNWVYARVRNNGTDPSLDFYVRIYIAHYPGFEFTYPDSFIPTNRPGDPVPFPMTPGTYLIGEVKGTGLAPGADTTVNVRWPAALVPPETVMVGPSTVHWHPCLLLEVAPHDGPAPAGNHVWDDNNLTQKNISIVYADADTDFAVGIVAGHRGNREALQVLEIDRGTLPRQVRLFVDLVDPRLKERLRQIGEPSGDPSEDDGCRVTFLEETRLLLDCPAEGRGEMVLTVPPQTRLERVLPTVSRRGYNFTLGTFQGREVAFLAGRGKTRIPLAAGRGALTTIIVGGMVGSGAPKGTFSVHLIQRDPDGEITGGAELEVNVR